MASKSKGTTAGFWGTCLVCGGRVKTSDDRTDSRGRSVCGYCEFPKGFKPRGSKVLPDGYSQPVKHGHKVYQHPVTTAQVKAHKVPASALKGATSLAEVRAAILAHKAKKA